MSAWTLKRSNVRCSGAQYCANMPTWTPMPNTGANDGICKWWYLYVKDPQRRKHRPHEQQQLQQLQQIQAPQTVHHPEKNPWNRVKNRSWHANHRIGRPWLGQAKALIGKPSAGRGHTNQTPVTKICIAFRHMYHVDARQGDRQRHRQRDRRRGRTTNKPKHRKANTPTGRQNDKHAQKERPTDKRRQMDGQTHRLYAMVSNKYKSQKNSKTRINALRNPQSLNFWIIHKVQKAEGTNFPNIWKGINK